MMVIDSSAERASAAVTPDVCEIGVFDRF